MTFLKRNSQIKMSFFIKSLFAINFCLIKGFANYFFCRRRTTNLYISIDSLLNRTNFDIPPKDVDLPFALLRRYCKKIFFLWKNKPTYDTRFVETPILHFHNSAKGKDLWGTYLKNQFQ